MGGIVGRFMKSFGLTMSFAILVSLLVSFTLTPMLSARWIKMRPRREDARARDPDHGRRTAASSVRSTTATRGCCRGRWRTARSWRALAVLILLSSVPLFMLANKNFLPNDDQSEFEVGAARAGRHEHRRDRADRQPHRDRGPARCRRWTTRWSPSPTIPPQTQNSGRSTSGSSHCTSASRDQFAVMDQVRDSVLPQFAAANLRTGVRPVATIGGGGNQNAEIQFTINGPDLGKLEKFATRSPTRRASRPGVVDLDTSLNVGKPELSVHLDRLKAADLGVRCRTRPRRCDCWSAATR